VYHSKNKGHPTCSQPGTCYMWRTWELRSCRTPRRDTVPRGSRGRVHRLCSRWRCREKPGRCRRGKRCNLKKKISNRAHDNKKSGKKKKKKPGMKKKCRIRFSKFKTRNTKKKILTNASRETALTSLKEDRGLGQGVDLVAGGAGAEAGSQGDQGATRGAGLFTGGGLGVDDVRTAVVALVDVLRVRGGRGRRRGKGRGWSAEGWTSSYPCNLYHQQR
jgi:hypothetical protein